MDINPITKLTPAIIAKAWRSPEFAKTLPAALQAQLPDSPAGDSVAELRPDNHESRRSTNFCTQYCHTAKCVTVICQTTRSTLCR